MAAQTKLVGLFIDLDNVVHAVGDARRYKVTAKQVHALVDHVEAETDGEAVVRTVYTSPQMQRHSRSYTSAGFRVETCNTIAGDRRNGGKNASDIAMVLGCVDAVQYRGLDEVVVFSNDSDFTPLMTWLRSRDVEATILLNGRVSDVYRMSADTVLRADGLAAFDPAAATSTDSNGNGSRPRKQQSPRPGASSRSQTTRPKKAPAAKAARKPKANPRPAASAPEAVEKPAGPKRPTLMHRYAAAYPQYAPLAWKLAEVDGFQPYEPRIYRAVIADTARLIRSESIDSLGDFGRRLVADMEARGEDAPSKGRLGNMLYPLYRRGLLELDAPTAAEVHELFVAAWTETLAARDVQLTEDEQTRFVEMIGGRPLPAPSQASNGLRRLASSLRRVPKA